MDKLPFVVILVGCCALSRAFTATSPFILSSGTVPLSTSCSSTTLASSRPSILPAASTSTHVCLKRNRRGSSLWAQKGQKEKGGPKVDAKAGADAKEEKKEEEKKDPNAEIKAKIASLSARVVQAENWLARAQEKAEENGKTGYVRLAAEVDNYRRRSVDDNKSLMRTSRAEVLQSFNKVLEKFEEAESVLQPSTEGEVKYHTAYQGLYRQFFDVFTKLGGAAYKPEPKEEYKSFRHEKVEGRHSEDIAEGMIIECIREGLAIDNQPFRKALVVVSEGSAKKKEEEKKQQEQKEKEGAIDTEAVADKK